MTTKTTPTYTPLYRVTLTLCELCLDGKGGECHTPGCALWMNRSPDVPLRFNATRINR